MIATILSLLNPLIALLANQFGLFGLILAYLLAISPIVSILIELLELIVKLTQTNKDDEAVAKIQAVWDKVLPYIELLPHVNLPLAPIVMVILKYVVKGASALKGAILGWLAPKPPSL